MVLVFGCLLPMWEIQMKLLTLTWKVQVQGASQVTQLLERVLFVISIQLPYGYVTHTVRGKKVKRPPQGLLFKIFSLFYDSV